MLGLAVLGLGGCVQRNSTQFVALRPVPNSPSFVVDSFNNYQAQVMCAELAQGALINSGVKVVRKPHLKKVETIKKTGTAQDKFDKKEPSSLLSHSDEIRIESYSQYDKINADYLVKTNGFITHYDGVPYIEKINILISKLDGTHEILASFVTYEWSINEDMYKALKALGITIRLEE
jgi:hypothetical protein